MLFIPSLTMFLGLAAATSFQAWSGDHCDGSAGSRVTVGGGGSCEKVSGRHSWEADGDNVKGFYYSAEGCQGASTFFTGNNGACNNINTGGPVGSMCVIGSRNSGCGL
ncbi:MAG: hypothetical protein GOMPHAMPRED_002347 [Gomphillus americanus]|uniref:Uncharacterized protein n=1 Tax=Gomphillus americanus TaxID=1940652 RepID=A0A8H3FBK2_9LECA|nr:MAG: hypothetical protein GOMPHAMPRED_002347 [Gomphillus americanus]